jgi:hypothetical protein
MVLALVLVVDDGRYEQYVGNRASCYSPFGCSPYGFSDYALLSNTVLSTTSTSATTAAVSYAATRAKPRHALWQFLKLSISHA